MDESCVPKREFGSERSLTKSCTYHWEEQAGEMACSEAAKSLLRVMRGELEVGLSSHERSRTAGACDRVRLFDCASCQGFMAQPICFPCGHSLCKSCAVKASAGTRCPKCGADWPRLSPPACEEASASADSRVPTVVLQSALRKWCPQWFACSRSKEEGNRLARAGEYRLAVEAYTRALESGAPLPQPHPQLRDCVCVFVCVCRCEGSQGVEQPLAGLPGLGSGGGGTRGR